MRERRHRDLLYVVRRDEVAPVKSGLRARQLEQRQRPAWAGADLDLGAFARRGHEVDGVTEDGGVGVHLLNCALHRQQLVAVDDCVQLDLVLAALQAPRE